VLRSFTVEPAIPLLRASAFCNQIDLTVQLGDFNAYAQELLDHKSSLYAFAPNVVVLAVRTADVAPDLWNSSGDQTAEDIRQIAQRVSASFKQWIGAFRQQSSAALIVHNLEQPIQPAMGLLDAQREASQSETIRHINSELLRSASSWPGVYVLDYDALVARHGRLRWHDERKWLTARMPVAADQLIHLSREWLRFLAPLTGKVAKALVVDLDNTLWGGVIGEDGMTGIKLGPEYPGAAYQALQRALLDLTRKGILLAISSKNNPDDALEALQSHPGMLLRPKDFAALSIGWNDKSQGLRQIASELNIGLESLAFLDDNPVEREQIRASLPEVMVIELPEDPLQYAATLRTCPALERLTLSSEDQQRTAMYAEQKERAQAEQTFQSKEDFYRFLQQEAEISSVTPATLSRIAQLTQKTNQFNLTTHRYSEQQISEMAGKPDWQVLAIRIRDRFGDHGLVGVAICHEHDQVCEIDTFLLSCRVIGRTVETALLSYLATKAAARGCRRLVGRFLPTRKNAPAREFYPLHGFRPETHLGEDGVWSLNLQEQKIACPDWVKLSNFNGGHN
jgi:FkbH-like protein